MYLSITILIPILNFMKLIKLFKYEIIKILIFLFLFFSTLVIVLSAQENYYDHNRNGYNYKDLHSLENLQSRNNSKN
jgi:hypothetical protein